MQIKKVGEIAIATVSASEVVFNSKLPEATVYLIAGSDEFLINEVCKVLRKQAVDPDFGDFNFDSIECTSQTKAGTLRDAMFELPVMTDHRLLELRNIQNLTVQTCKEIVPDLTDTVKDKRTIIAATWKNAKGKTTNAFKTACEKHCLKVDCTLNDAERSKWIESKIKSLGLKASVQVITEIMNRTGNDLQNLSVELDNLAGYLGDNKTVSVENIRRLVRKSTETKIWEYTAAVSQKNIKGAIEAADAILGNSPGGGAFGLFSYINSYLRGLAQVMHYSKRYGNSSSALQSYMPDKKEYQIRKTIQELNTWSEKDLLKAFDALCRADLNIKTGGDHTLTVQLLTLQLCYRRGAKR